MSLLCHLCPGSWNPRGGWEEQRILHVSFAAWQEREKFQSCLLLPFWLLPCNLFKTKSNKNILHRNLTWNLKMMVSKRNILFRGRLFRFHVKFQGCNLRDLSIPKVLLSRRLPALGPTVTGKIYSGQIHKGDKISCSSARVVSDFVEKMLWCILWKVLNRFRYWVQTR